MITTHNMIIDHHRHHRSSLVPVPSTRTHSLAVQVPCAVLLRYSSCQTTMKMTNASKGGVEKSPLNHFPSHHTAGLISDILRSDPDQGFYHLSR